MAKFILTGAALGVRRTPYDFKDDDGKQVAGETLTLVLFDEDTTTSHEVKIKRSAAGRFAALEVGEVVHVDVDVYATLRNGNSVLSITAYDVRNVDAEGARPVQAAS